MFAVWKNSNLDHHSLSNCQLPSTLCSEKKTPTHIFFHIAMNDVRFKQKLHWIYLRNGRFWQCRNKIFIVADDVIWRHICKRLWIRTYRQNTALFHSIIQRLIINNNQLFNIRQQEYYLVTDELKYHNLCSKYAAFCLTQVWICLHESPTLYDIQLL